MKRQTANSSHEWEIWEEEFQFILYILPYDLKLPYKHFLFFAKKKKIKVSPEQKAAGHAHISCAPGSLFLGSYQQSKALSSGRALTPACQALLLVFLQSITSCLSSRFPVAGQLELLQKDKQEGHSYQCRLSCQLRG